jgi:hypothetical protein
MAQPALHGLAHQLDPHALLVGRHVVDVQHTPNGLWVFGRCLPSCRSKIRFRFTPVWALRWARPARRWPSLLDLLAPIYRHLAAGNAAHLSPRRE